ncbi:MAG TPA: NfeD family protein [Spirochaetales bacterium]|nr:NfeD family protein [Spirochaetales bacterium]HRY55106.1 NfeD family protein [Spirochaetia bacterium]HRZ64645.1 NfeD family protein [Spirochaetia bacterium]
MFGAWFWWAAAGLVLVCAETFIPGLAVIFFGLGALATSLLCLVPPFAASPALQALFWTASSLASLALLRRPLMRILRGSVFYRIPEEEVDPLEGEPAIVTERVGPEEPGRVRFRGTSWKALAYLETLEPGEEVRVVSREGLALVVTKDFLDPSGESEAAGGLVAGGADSDKEVSK